MAGGFLSRLRRAAGRWRSAAGFVDHIGFRDASGWAIDRRGNPVEITVRLGRHRFRPSVTWHERADVAARHGPVGAKAGFSIRFPPSLCRMLGSDAAAGKRLRIIANGAPLQLSSGARVARRSKDRTQTRSPISSPVEAWFSGKEDYSAPIAIRIDRVDGFRILGWLGLPSLPDGLLGILCNGIDLEVSATLADESEPEPTHARGRRDGVFFEFELPGFLWQHGTGDGHYALQLTISSRPLAAPPILITAAHACTWLADAAEGLWGEDARATLLALEHAHFLPTSTELDEVTAAYLIQAAQTFGLDQYLSIPAPAHILAVARNSGPHGTNDESHPGQLRLWRALREFNEELPRMAGREEELLEAVLARHTATAGLKFDLICGLTPFFCRIKKFDAVRPRLTPEQVEALVRSGDRWSTSLALPFLVRAGNIEEAARLIHALPGSRAGWINSDCIADASQWMADFGSRSIDYTDIDRFAYAVIACLDGLRGDYWSRLHDLRLIDSLACWIDRRDFCNEWLRRDLVSASIRIYGLCPAFWQRCPPSTEETESKNELHVARRQFEFIQRGLSSRSHWPHSLERVWEGLEFFRRYRNPEADFAIRELTCTLLPELHNMVTEGCLPTRIAGLLSLSPEDALRVAAYPLAGENRFMAALPNLGSLIALMADFQARSPRYRAQRASTLGLVNLSSALKAGDLAATARLCAELRTCAAALSDSSTAFLGFDVLASACLLLARAGESTRLLLPLMLRQREAAVDALKDGELPPASLTGGLATLEAALAIAEDSALRDFLVGTLALLHAHCGPRISELLRDTSQSSRLDWQAGQLNDTLVVVYSCRKYLDTRVAAIRATWVADLRERGIPYLVLVGEGNDTVEGDVLALDVSDHYEDLPRKTLKLVEWVLTHTAFQYLVKIDDDCYLNVREYFDSRSYRKWHYYGRRIDRPLGGTDRAWHQSRSQGRRASRSLDKSPEPSVYADGGSGYSLSRVAMRCLLQGAQSADGKRLIASSYMEDKFVGDLLARTNVMVSDEDYPILVRRRTFADALPISIYENSFFPSSISPIKLAHLDADASTMPTRSSDARSGLWPKKIWPSYAPPSIKRNVNQLELLSTTQKTQELLTEDLLVVAVARNERVMLPHFLDHYRRLGVRSFVFVDNASDDGSRELLHAQDDVVLYSADTEYRHSYYGVAWQQAVLANHCVGKWVLLADVDEFLVLSDNADVSLAERVREIESGGYDAACVFMVDMYPFGDLAEADFSRAPPFDAAPWFDAPSLLEWRLGSGHYSNSRSFTSALRHRLIPSAEPNAFTVQKFCLFRYAPWIRLSQGLHSAANIRPAPEPLWFAHFKYHAGFKQKVATEVRRKQHFSGAKEYQAYQSLLAEAKGGFGMSELSRKYGQQGNTPLRGEF